MASRQQALARPQHDRTAADTPMFGLRDGIVVLAMLTVAGASGIAASVHMDLPEPLSAAIALAVACLLLALHVISMRVAQPSRPAPSTDGRGASDGPVEPAIDDPLTTAVLSLAAGRREPVLPLPNAPLNPTSTAPVPGHSPSLDISSNVVPQREHVITQSVAALRSAATSLAAADAAFSPQGATVLDHPMQLDQTSSHRAPLDPTPATAAIETGRVTSIDRTSPGDAQRLADIADAIRGQHLETAVSVIPSLVEAAVQHHEIIVRLKTRAGEMLIPDALQPGERASDLLPLLEALKISRAVRLAAALIAEGLNGALLSSHTADVLLNDRAMQTLVQPLADTADGAAAASSARYVVLSFPQAEVRRFTQAHWARLADLADLGFRFALEQVADLDADFELLRNVGVMFLRMDATVMKQGVPGPGGPVEMAGLPRLVAALGLTLIVSHVDSETDLAQLTTIGVPFGQGGLFRAQERIATIADPDAIAA